VVDVAGADVTAILTRAPSAGGKTRLFASLGRSFDPALLSALLLDTLDGVTCPEARVVVAVTPSSACAEVAALVGPRARIVPQGGGDLGARMRDTMASLVAAGARAVALVGSDLPTLTSGPIRQAFNLLERQPDALVLGPALDGGYYLIAATRVPAVFDGIEWGTAQVLEQTRRAADAARMPVYLVDAVADIDTAGDLEELSRTRLAPGSAVRTRAWIKTALRTNAG